MMTGEATAAVPTGTTRRSGFEHNPALDGIRGFAVAVVVLYHTGLIHGGWIGVEVFFVLSGYLITSLLLGEIDRTGRVDLVAFWRRRARRLLPALYVTLGVAAVFVLAVSPRTAYGTIRRDVIGALTYSSNWVSIFGGNGYWQQFAVPSPLRHMWSLAVEEQFYVVYPLLAVAVLRPRVRQWAIPTLAAVALAWQLWSVAHVALDRFYLGTDTRAFGILIGALVALVPQRVGDRAGAALGVVAVTGLVAASLWLDGSARGSFHGPFQLCSLAAAALVLAVRPTGPTWLRAWCSSRPLTLLGRWSYGIYLFHWPVAEALRQRWDLGAVAVTLVTVPVSLAVAGLSYRWIESPIRHSGLGGRRRASGGLAIGAACAVAALVTTTVGSERSLSAADVADEVAPQVSSPSDGPLAVFDGILERPLDRPYRVMLVGDSVGASLVPALEGLVSSAGIEVFSRAAPSCSYDRERTSSGGDFQEDQSCVDIVAGWRTDVATFRPDVVYFVYGSWSGWYYQDAFRTQCDPVLADRVTELYSLALDDLTSAGARVVFVGPPYWRANGTDEGLDTAYDCLRDVMQRFVAAHNDVASYVDLHHLVCDGSDCDAMVGDQLARPDGLHFDGDAAVTATIELLRSALEPPADGWPASVPIERN